MQPIIINPLNTPTHTVIWLHGLGADGSDMASLVPELKLDDLDIRWVFPHAPIRPITLNNGLPMRGWYDIATLDRDHFIDDPQGTRTSAALIHELVQSQPCDAKNVILAGFSQGGAIALHTALQYPQQHQNVLALSTYLPMANTLPAQCGEGTSVLMMHGRFDNIIPIDAAKRSRDQLNALGCEVDWHEYPMAHTLCAEQISMIAQWFRSVAGNSVT